MKLNKEIKDRIDNYFNSISAEDLYEISVNNYEFIEETGIEISNQKFENISVENVNSETDESYEILNSYKFALAA